MHHIGARVNTFLVLTTRPRAWFDSGMTLDAWMRARGMTMRDLAKRLGVSSETVRRWLIGARLPRRQHLAALRALTGGEVTADSFVAERAAAERSA